MKHYFKTWDFIDPEDSLVKPGTTFVTGKKIFPLVSEFNGVHYSLIVKINVVVEVWYEPFPPHGPAKTNDLVTYDIQLLYASTPEEEITCMEDLNELQDYLKTQIVLT